MLAPTFKLSTSRNKFKKNVKHLCMNFELVTLRCIGVSLQTGANSVAFQGETVQL